MHLIEDAEPLGPLGAKGVGEPALIADGAGDPERDPRTRPACACTQRAGDARAACARRSSRAARSSGDVAASDSFAPRSDRPAGRLEHSRAPETDGAPTRCAATRARCSARSAPGKLGACDRYGNVDGMLDAHRHRCASSPGRGIDLVALAGGAGRAADGTLVRRAMPTRRCSSRASAPAPPIPTTSPRPFIVASKHAGVDMVTVVTEGIFSYCSFKVKIDTDRYLGPEQATVRCQRRGGRPRHHGRVRLADALARRRAPPHRRHARRKAASPATLMMDARQPASRSSCTIDGGAQRRRRRPARRRSSTASRSSACASAAARRRSASSRSSGSATSTRWSSSTTTSPAC